MSGKLASFVDGNYKHFNAAALANAARAYKDHVKKGGKMLLAMGGAMSTAEQCTPPADMIRCNKIYAISCTGANLEEVMGR